MKDAKGHGSDPRGGNTFVGDGSKVKPGTVTYGSGNNKSLGPQLDIAKIGGGQPVASDAHAAATLASGSKSVPVDTHPSMSGGTLGWSLRAQAQAGQMKMSAGDFAALKAAVVPHIASTADPSHSAMRQRWDALNKSGYNTGPLYKAGLNDDHIDTALRRIQSQQSPKSDSYGGSYEGPGKGRWPKNVMKG